MCYLLSLYNIDHSFAVLASQPSNQRRSRPVRFVPSLELQSPPVSSYTQRFRLPAIVAPTIQRRNFYS